MNVTQKLKFDLGNIKNIAVTGIFSFSHNIFNSLGIFWVKGLPITRQFTTDYLFDDGFAAKQPKIL